MRVRDKCLEDCIKMKIIRCRLVLGLPNVTMSPSIMFWSVQTRLFMYLFYLVPRRNIWNFMVSEILCLLGKSAPTAAMPLNKICLYSELFFF